MKNKIIKICAWIIGFFAVACIVLMLICNQIMDSNAEGKVFSDIDSIKYNKVGLLLGTTPKARIGRITNYFFIYRIDAAEKLYKAGKIEKILISGDDHRGDKGTVPLTPKRREETLESIAFTLNHIWLQDHRTFINTEQEEVDYQMPMAAEEMS
jgi:hypothetical protein